MNENTKDLIAISWNTCSDGTSIGHWHTESLEQCLEKNQAAAFLHGRGTGWEIVAVTTSIEAASAMIEIFIGKRKLAKGPNFTIVSRSPI